MSQLVESAIGWAVVALVVVAFLRSGGKVRSVLRTASVILGFVSFWPILGVLFRASADYSRVSGYETFVMLGTIALCALPPVLMFSLTRASTLSPPPQYGTARVLSPASSDSYQSSDYDDSDDDPLNSDTSDTGKENSNDEDRSSRVADYQKGFEHGVEMRKETPDTPVAMLFPDAFFGVLDSHIFREGFSDGILGNDMRSVDDL